MLTGLSNSEKIWNWLKSKGFNEYACAGIIANLDAESGLNPKNVQDSCQARLGMDDETYTAMVDSGVYKKEQFVHDATGYAICQWTWKTRKLELYEYAKSRNTSIGDLEMQLEFFYKELSESYRSVLNSLLSASSVSDATKTVMLKYECPADQSVAAQNRRVSLAQKYYTLYTTNNKGGTSNMGYKYYTKGRAVKVSDHFYSTEFDCHGSGCCSQTIVNERLPGLLEQIRTHFNAPISITSPYRCPTHNSRIGGAVGSRHSRGDAVDIVVKGVPPRKVAQYAESIGILGIGLYETAADGYFVHIDTRDYRSFWYGQDELPRTTFGQYGSDIIGDNSSNTSNVDTIINMGDKGSAVKALQEKLIRLGFSCGINGADGDFGVNTYYAVRKFQEKHSLGVDGIAGSNTLTAIDKAISALDSVSNDKSVKITASVLNVRSGAGLTYPVIGGLRRNAVCTVIEEKDGWGRIKNPAGWISSQYYTEV